MLVEEFMVVASLIILMIIPAAISFFRPVLGFIAALVFSVAVFVYGAAFEMLDPFVKMEVFIIAPSIFFLAMPVIAFGPRREGAEWIRIWARNMLLVCGLLFLTIWAFAFLGMWGGFGLVFVQLFVSAVIGAFTTSELARSSYVITTIGASMRQNLPLPMAMEMAAAGQDNKRADILRNIKKWIVEGYPLSESMRRGYPKCPAYITAMVAAGERIGQVPQAIAALEQDLIAKANTNKKIRHVPLLYPPLVLLIMFMLMLFMVTFIIPKYESVLREMVGSDLPAATRTLLGISTFITKDYGWLLGSLLVLVFIIGSLMYVRVKSRPRRVEKPYLISRIGDFVKWHVPFIRWYEWCRAMQRVAGMLRLSLNAGCTVNEAIASSLKMDLNQNFKKGLKEWLASVERGDDIGRSARQCGMGSAMAWAFADVHNNRNTLDILETLETSYRWGYNRAATLARFIIGPCQTICLGLMVGFIAYAMFSPIILIIYDTARSITP
jgi:type IV pilus assembly protein PilC